ncbi:MAG TPA: hypothetical protein VLT45_10170 [Kofleriaceae bacterium]|nr:hypothetical protein [Kofleriaceae bacterium]
MTRSQDIEIQTHIRADPQLAALRVGDRIGPLDPVGYGYLAVRPVGPDERIRVVEDWACKAGCGFYPNWCEITIDHGVITSIAPTAIDGALLARANYITPEAKSTLQEISGTSYVALRGRPRWPAASSPDSRELARLAHLADEDAAALLGVDESKLSDEERAFLRDIRAVLQRRDSLEPSQIDKLHLIAQHLP